MRDQETAFSGFVVRLRRILFQIFPIEDGVIHTLYELSKEEIQDHGRRIKKLYNLPRGATC